MAQSLVKPRRGGRTPAHHLKSQISNLKSAGAPPLLLRLFDFLSDTPNPVTKMRELVLQLAVQGKLVYQEQGDGDATQLLTAISRERHAQTANLRTPEEPESADGGELPFQIPATWAWTQLGTIALQ